MDSEETLMLFEESRSKMLLIMLEKKVNTTLVDYARLNQLSQDFVKRFVPQTELSAEQGFWSQNFVISTKPTLSRRPTIVEVPKELPKAVEQHRLESKTFKVKMNQVLNENERLLEQVISKDIVNILVNSSVNIASVNVHECEKCLKLETELLNKKDFVEKEIYNKLFKSFTTLEKHCISLEVDIQHNQEIFQRDNSVSNQSALSFDQLFELNELKAQSQEKDTVIKKLKERIKSLSGKQNEDKIKNRTLKGFGSKDCGVQNPKGTAHVQHSKLNANSELKCVKCNGCMLSDNHDLCVLDFINNVNAHKKSKSVNKSSKRKVWKPTGKVFSNIGYIWRPTGRTFTIVGNACPLTRITTTTEVPLRKPTALENETPKPVVTLVYSRKPRKSKTNVPISKSKVLKSVSANKKEPSPSWGSIVSDVPSSSLAECRCRSFSYGLILDRYTYGVYVLYHGSLAIAYFLLILSAERLWDHRPLGLFFLVLFLLSLSPMELCGLVPYSDSDSDSPDEMSSLEHISSLPAISPFLCTDSFEAPDSYDGPPSQDPYIATVAREEQGIRRRSMILIRPGEAIPFDLPYCTHLNGPRKLLTARKRVGPLRAHRLSMRHASPRLDASDQAHYGSSTRDVPPRLCYPPRRAPRHSEAFRRWCTALYINFYSTDYIQRHSLGDSSERPPAFIFTFVDIDLGIGDEDDVRDHVEIDPRDVRDDTKEYEADASDGDIVEVGIDLIRTDCEEEIVVQVGDSLINLALGMHCLGIRDMTLTWMMSRLRDFTITCLRGQRVSMIERIDSLRLENLKVCAMLDIERDRVNSLRLHMSLSQEEFCQVHRDHDDTRGRLRRDFDELCEEIVVNSSGIEKYSDYVMNLYDNGKETESRVSAMGDENTIGEQYGNEKEDVEFILGVHLLRKCNGLRLVEAQDCEYEGDDAATRGRFPTPMEFLDRKMAESGYKMTICDLNKLDDGVNGSFAIMGVFSKCNFEGLLPAKQVILLDRKMMGNGDKRVVYGLNK
ncbi:hypothetical protein Tco_0533762 [Tanacetum coccineum]